MRDLKKIIIIFSTYAVVKIGVPTYSLALQEYAH